MGATIKIVMLTSQWRVKPWYPHNILYFKGRPLAAQATAFLLPTSALATAFCRAYARVAHVD